MVRPTHAPQDVTAIYRQLQPKLKRYLRKFGVGETDLDDLVQDCFVSYLTSGRAMSLGSASAFLVTTARHRAIDLWRKHKSAALHPLEGHEEHWARPAHDAIPTAFYLERLMAQVDAMNSQHPSSLTFKKFYSEGKSLHEIAAEFGEPLGTISGRVFRMRRQFRDKWRRDLETFEDELERAGFDA
ncbi:MAG TPA: sigma-70 family RNA polymerase sigma factor [Oligoflexus sp.]|uniref:RNA polymerase sigma factor n=1 Tax=Oligoflexus sp. TaxID=1971216 RepID=UPI002D802A6E|nr:sigma-70 family RNA polymerase sigma factor [Oligoflexus sp.]HET9240947.1 sigma-70 family RNA polymerase sigma factor [Oligoflexus sp.]